jgi:hypothetical protein
VQAVGGGTFGGGDAVARRVGGGDGGGGDAGREGGAGMPGGGESGSASSSAGGVEGGEVSEGKICVEAGADGEGGAFGGGVAEHDRGERSRSRSSSKSLSSSASFRRFLILLTAGGRSSGEERGGGVAVGRGTSPPARATETGDGSVCAGAARVAVAERPRRRRRWRRRQRLLATVAFSAGAGKVHVTVMVWHPATWLVTKRAFRPLAIHLSNSAENSAAVMAGGGPVQVASSPRVYTSPLATLPHVGGPREVWGRGEGLKSWHPAGPAGLPTTPRWGRRGGLGRGGMTAILLRCCDRPPRQGG